jgi:hypothetical protein
MNLFPTKLLRAPAVLFGCIACLCGFLHAADSATPGKQYTAAQEAFEKGDYRKALSIGENIISDGNLSPALFQLMGNTRYRQGDLGRAALWYQRAALFPPPNAETRQNLAHVHDKTGSLSFPGNTFGDQIVAYLTRTQWLAIAVCCGWVWVFFHLMAYLVVRAGELRAFMVTIGVVSLLGGIIGFTCWYYHPSYEQLKDLYVVTSPNVSAHTAASVTSGNVITLPPGSEVRKLDDRGAWCYVEIPSSHGETNRGWVQKEILSPFWPFKPGYLE